MSDAKRPSPHDRLVKWVLSRPEATGVELRHVLPSALCAVVDWDSLVVSSESYVSPSLGERIGDLVCTMELRGDDRGAELWVPIEHQSTPCHPMAWRMLCCAHGLWHRHRRDRAGTKQPMPLVIPVVLAQTKRPWTSPRCISELVAMPTELSNAIPPPIELRYLVDELDGTVLDDPLGSEGMIALVEAMRTLLRWARRPQQITDDRIAWLAHLLEIVMDQQGLEDLRALWTYVVNAFPPGSALRRPLIDSASPAMQEHFFSIYDEAIAKGMSRGRSEGLATGLLQVLEHHALSLSRAQRRRITSCTREDLLRAWLDRALTARSIEDVFAE